MKSNHVPKEINEKYIKTHEGWICPTCDSLNEISGTCSLCKKGRVSQLYYTRFNYERLVLVLSIPAFAAVTGVLIKGSAEGLVAGVIVLICIPGVFHLGNLRMSTIYTGKTLPPIDEQGFSVARCIGQLAFLIFLCLAILIGTGIAMGGIWFFKQGR